jgi:hypothetical protein
MSRRAEPADRRRPSRTTVFRYTVHGMVNGSPVALKATSPPIEMVD